MVKRAVTERLRCRVAVLCEYLFFKRTGVYADPYRDAPLSARVGDLLYPIVLADIAGVYTDLINTGGARLKR